MGQFFIPKNNSVIANNATRDLFEQTMTKSRDRTQTYKRWSEKATIVLFHEETESYDIVVTTITYSNTSAAVQKVNRTIRNVRSIIPSSVYIFKAGEIVLIGYISERRESPVILGLKAAKASKNVTVVTDTPNTGCSITILNRSNQEDITDAPVGTYICSGQGVDSSYSICLEAICGPLMGAWHWDHPQCTMPDGSNGYSVEMSGINNRYVCFRKNEGYSNFGSTHPCYARVTCIRYQENIADCTVSAQSNFYNSAGQTIVILGESCSSSFGGSCEDCYNTSCPACNDAGCIGCPVEIVPCTELGDIPTIASDLTDVAYQLGYTVFQHEGGEMDTVLTSEEQADNLDGGGCCVCPLSDGSILSFDSDDSSWSMELRQSAGNLAFPVDAPEISVPNNLAW